MKTLLAFLLSAGTWALAEQAQFIRYPDLSPDGTKIAFSYQGDIWVVSSAGGTATRLSTHPGLDKRPKWSPDGSRIAFESQRDGTSNVFSMKADGTDVRQHSLLPTANTLLDWRADGKKLLFKSSRVNSYHWLDEPYQVDLDGGTPERLLAVPLQEATETPNGKTLVYNNGYAHSWRKRYRGDANNDIFAYHYKKKQFVQLTDFEGNDLNPLATDNHVFFISDMSGTFNLHRMKLDGSEKTQLTQFKDDGVRHAGMSRDGQKIALTHYLDLYLLDVTSSDLQKLVVHVPEDSPYEDTLRETFSSDLRGAALSPKKEEFAVVYHGELYALKADDEENGRIARVTDNAAWDRNPVWSADGETLYFTSDRNGNFDVYAATSKDGAPFYLNKYFSIKRLTETEADETQLNISPDGKQLLFLRGLGDLVAYNLEDGSERNLLTGWNLVDYSFSPDSRWLGFSRYDANYNSDVFIMPLAGGEPVNITQHPDTDYQPVFSPDGKTLFYSSQRFGTTYDVMYVYLTEKDDAKSKDDWELEEELKKHRSAPKEEEEDKAGDKKEEESEEELVVEIDFEDIHKRQRRLTRHLGDEVPVGVSEDGETVVYLLNEENNTNFYATTLWENKPKPLTSGNQAPRQAFMGDKHKNVYYVNRGGQLKSVDTGGKADKTYKFKGSFDVHNQSEWMQVFQDIWRIQNENFYDPNFHGADWPKLREHYRKIVAAVRSESDFSDAMNMLIGELNSSHQRYRKSSGQSPSYGVLGARLQPATGGVEITHILPEGPLTKSQPEAQVGDVIMAVNGEPFENFWETMRDTIGELVDLNIRRGKEDLIIQVRPISRRSQENLVYDEWVETNREKVHQGSQGKLGYIHMDRMNINFVERFETELFSEAQGKDALVIDVRFNKGGWTTDLILSMLTAADHAYTINRDGEKGYPQVRRTYFTWHKPIVVLCNEFSYSNGEIFSHAVKSIGRGTLVGRKTFGAVISTGGQTLLNGAWIRMPFRGWYVKGSDLNQELNGAEPHFTVIPQQDERITGVDSQLQKAIDLFNSGKLQ